MTDPVDDRTHRVTPQVPEDETLLAQRRTPDDETLLAERRTDDATLLAERRTPDDETLLAERRTDDATRAAQRRGRSVTGTRPVAHGRADTPRTASAAGALPSRAVYAPRGADTLPAITRAPVAPPTPPAPPPPARSRRGGIIAVGIAGAAVVAGAAWGIVQIVQGGM
ncbi:hypothetical protein ACIQLK_07530 [Microbacterium sp. NPDC091382]|uniref:hypothetical protein n=1 Tax=Microbacterium sp. NPDC091382 TaxID=3364210 RepID=UPI0038104D06